jgi:hypothetical protein
MPIDDKTLCQIEEWKNEQLHKYCVSLVSAAIHLQDSGISFFGSDDVPEEDQPESKGIPGSAIHVLRGANVIDDFFGSIRDQKIVFGQRKSKRSLANGRKIKLYSLKSRGMAVEYLKRHGVKTEPVQMEMELFG